MCYLTAFQHLSGRVTELLATSKAINELNQAAFLNLWLDYQCICTIPQSQKVPHEYVLSDIQQLCALFVKPGDPKEVLDEENYRMRYSKLNLSKVVLILEEYRNDK